MERKLVREVGNWVSGDRFWNRDTELSLLSEMLEEGAHIMLVAPRRVGKTSLMREAAARLEGIYQCVFVDVQNCSTPGEAIAQVGVATREVRGLWDRTKEAFKNVLGQVDELGVDEISIKLRSGLASEWAPRGSNMLRSLAKSEMPVVIFIDELPILLFRMMKTRSGELDPMGIEKADLFMSWLRSMTIEHRGRIRFVIAGSIGIEPVLRRVGLSATVNTFTPFELKPWSQETAMSCLLALANQYGLGFDEGVRRHMVERLGICVPHHVQMYFGHVYTQCRRENTTACTKDLADRVYEESMLTSRGHAELFHLEERLKMVLGTEHMALALDLLTEAAVVGVLLDESSQILAKDLALEGENVLPILRHVLDILVQDGYLVRHPAGWSFCSNLVRDWWKNRFSAGYRPAKQRG